MSVAVLCNWWNHPELWPSFADALWHEQYDELLIMDNNSDDETACLLSDNAFRIAGRVIRRVTNSQLEATAEAVAATTSDILLFVNNDVYKTKSGWVQEITKHVKPGMVVCVQMANQAGVHYPDGWCWAITRADWERLGGYDSDFREPPYFADVHLGYKMRKMGIAFGTVYDPGIQHMRSVSSRELQQTPAFWETYAYNRDLCFAKIAADLAEPEQGVAP